MKVGVTLPQFRPDAAAAIGVARAANAADLDGVFVFDHLWAIGRPDRPALAPFPLLGALAAETRRVHLGTLVARVAVVPEAVLVNNFVTLRAMVGNRLIAGLGTGDRASRPENEACGIPFLPAAVRVAAAAHCCRRLRALGITTWVGGASAAVRQMARAEADALNVWAAEPAEVAELTTPGAAGIARPVDVTWGGPVPAGVPALIALLQALREAGATWAVCAPAYAADPLPALDAVVAAHRALAKGESVEGPVDAR